MNYDVPTVNYSVRSMDYSMPYRGCWHRVVPVQLRSGLVVRVCLYCGRER